jgi:hypothetical protein
MRLGKPCVALVLAALLGLASTAARAVTYTVDLAFQDKFDASKSGTIMGTFTYLGAGAYGSVDIVVTASAPIADLAGRYDAVNPAQSTTRDLQIFRSADGADLTPGGDPDLAQDNVMDFRFLESFDLGSRSVGFVRVLGFSCFNAECSSVFTSKFTDISADIAPAVSEVPLPPALLLLGSAILDLGAVGRHAT